MFKGIEYEIESIGVAHGDDLFYMFNYEDYKLNKTDQIIREIVVDAWTKFAILTKVVILTEVVVLTDGFI